MATIEQVLAVGAVAGVLVLAATPEIVGAYLKRRRSRSEQHWYKQGSKFIRYARAYGASPDNVEFQLGRVIAETVPPRYVGEYRRGALDEILQWQDERDQEEAAAQAPTPEREPEELEERQGVSYGTPAVTLEEIEELDFWGDNSILRISVRDPYNPACWAILDKREFGVGRPGVQVHYVHYVDGAAGTDRRIKMKTRSGDRSAYGLLNALFTHQHQKAQLPPEETPEQRLTKMLSVPRRPRRGISRDE